MSHGDRSHRWYENNKKAAHFKKQRNAAKSREKATRAREEWTEKDENILISLAGDVSDGVIADILGRSIEAVKSRKRFTEIDTEDRRFRNEE